MSERKYEDLVRVWRRKSRLYPTGYRPWESSLRRAIHDAIVDGLRKGRKWARRAASSWTGVPESHLSLAVFEEAWERAASY